MFKNSPFICYIFFAIDGIALSAQYLCCKFFWSALSVQQDFSFC